MRPAQNLFTADEDARIKAMLDQGMFVKDIAKAINRPHSSVYNRIKRNNFGAIPFKQRTVMPTPSHPAITELRRAIKAAGRTIESVHAQAGLNTHAITTWSFERADPKVSNLEAALNCVGLRLAVLPLNRGEGE